jgi:hypothetical protein
MSFPDKEIRVRVPVEPTVYKLGLKSTGKLELTGNAGRLQAGTEINGGIGIDWKCTGLYKLTRSTSHTGQTKLGRKTTGDSL